MVGKGGKRQRPYAGIYIYFNHSAVEDDGNERTHHRHGEADYPGFQHQGKEFAQALCFQFSSDRSQGRRNINAGVCVNDPGALLHHCLCHLKDGDDKVECMADDVGRNPGLDDPFEKDERIKVVHIVPVYDHADQFIGQDCGNYKARDGDDYRLGQAVNHREDAGVPLLRRLSNFPCDSSDLCIYITKHIRQVSRDGFDQEILNPFCYRVDDKIHRPLPIH